MPANTGKAGAIYRVACFAGMPAPTDMPWPPCWRANLPAAASKGPKAEFFSYPAHH